MPKKILSVKVDEKVRDYLEKQAEKKEWTLSYLVNSVLSNYVKRVKA